MTQLSVLQFMLSPLCSVASGCVDTDKWLNVWSVWQASEDYAVQRLTEEVHRCCCFHVMCMSQRVSMHICRHDEYTIVLQCQAKGSFLMVSECML